MTAVGQIRSFGDVGSMSGLPESGHGWAIYEHTPQIAPLALREALGLILVAQPVETLLHLFHLALEVVDFVAAAARLRITLVRFSRRLSLAPRERREHGKRAFEHFHVPPHLLLHRPQPTTAPR